MYIVPIVSSSPPPRLPLCRQLKHALSLSHAAVPIDIDTSSLPPSTIGSFIFFLPPIATAINPPFPFSAPFLVNLPALVLWFFLPFFEESMWFFCYVDSTTVLIFLSVSLGNEWMMWWGLTATLPPLNVHGTWGGVGSYACLRIDFFLIVLLVMLFSRPLFLFSSVGGICECLSLVFFFLRPPVLRFFWMVVLLLVWLLLLLFGCVVLLCWLHSPKPTIHYFTYIYCCTQRHWVSLHLNEL